MRGLALVALAIAMMVVVVESHTLVQWACTDLSGCTTASVEAHVWQNGFIGNLQSGEMRCGFAPLAPATTSSVVYAGGYVGLQWSAFDYWSHKGPCIAYMSANGGASWFKVWEFGYINGQWCTEVLMGQANGGMGVPIPRDLATGEYLMRAEIIALHEVGAPQSYPNCIRVTVHSIGGWTIPPHTVAFPGTYSMADPGLAFNIYWPPFSSYPTPGGPVYQSTLLAAEEGMDAEDPLSAFGTEWTHNTLEAHTPNPDAKHEGAVAGLSPAMAIVVTAGAAVFIALVVVVSASIHYRRTGKVFGFYLTRQAPEKNGEYQAFRE